LGSLYVSSTGDLYVKNVTVTGKHTAAHGLMGGTTVALFTHGYGHAVLEVGGSNRRRGTMVGGVFNPTKQLVGFSPPNMPSIINSKFV